MAYTSFLFIKTDIITLPKYIYLSLRTWDFLPQVDFGYKYDSFKPLRNSKILYVRTHGQSILKMMNQHILKFVKALFTFS